jgi:shikimate dehydrogenase
MSEAPHALSGHTRPYAVLGHPIGHSLSPVMHNASFASLGLDAIYLAFDVAPDHLLHVLDGMRHMGFGGVNLTVPLKEVAFAGLDRKDASAELVGAVNTVRFDDQGAIGYNTDGDGFLDAYAEAFGQPIAGQQVFVLGTGGAGRAVALTAARAKAAGLTLADVDAARAQRLADELNQRYPNVPVTLADQSDYTAAMQAADTVVQSTPIGMNAADPCLVTPSHFRAGQHVYDLIYMTPETPFLTAARQAGARIANGLGMLLHQGARAYTIWSGQTADVAAMRAALEKAVYGA